MKVETTAENVLKAASTCAQSRATLEVLFPEVFQDTKPFCKIGQLFIRNEYQNSVYSIMQKDSHVVVMNITHSAEWAEKKRLHINDLENYNTDKSITGSEFKQLTGYVDLSKFKVIDTVKLNQYFKTL